MIDLEMQPIKLNSISKSIVMFPWHTKQNVKKFVTTLHYNDAFVIDSNNAFELALVLKKKQLSAPLLKKTILTRIEEKNEELTKRMTPDSICLVGHSQIDNWDVTEIAGYKVQNAGIRGISSAEYSEYILDNGLLHCDSDVYIVMHGTNDIVTELLDEEIIESIRKTFDYINLHHAGAKIYFLSCAHVNGRLDRDNSRIDILNAKLETAFKNEVTYVGLGALDNEFNELDSSYTLDGLHFNDHGYMVLKQIVEEIIS